MTAWLINNQQRLEDEGKEEGLSSPNTVLHQKKEKPSKMGLTEQERGWRVDSYNHSHKNAYVCVHLKAHIFTLKSALALPYDGTRLFSLHFVQSRHLVNIITLKTEL